MQILSLYVIGCIAVEGLRIQNHVVSRMPTLALPDVFGPVTTEMFERARRRRSQAAKKAHALPGEGSRARNLCDMCVNLVLHQDTTLDWTTEFRSRIGGQFLHILQDLSDSHPGSTFSVVTFQDKPVPELGELTDYCVSYDARMLSDPMEVLQTYLSTPEGVGYDWPENSFGSLYELVNSPTYLPWAEHSECSNLVITITDAAPHYEGDEWQVDYPTLTEYTADYEEKQAEAFCTQRYYPTPYMVADTLVEQNIYHGTIVWRAGDLNTLALRGWAWFDSLVGEADAFTQALFDDDQDWMTPLETILAAFIGEECGPITTTTVAPSTTGQETDRTIGGAGTDEILTTEGSTPFTEPSTASPLPTEHQSAPSEHSFAPSTTAEPTGTTETSLLPSEEEPVSSTPTTTTSVESATSFEVTDGSSSPATHSPTGSTSTAMCYCPSEDPCCVVQPELYLMIKKKPAEFDMHMKA